ncbi:SGNH/GDSL hydrolase family protein [Flavobacterium sp. CS20]|uniref:SGNH/GDSL hydrolase family protein n=1 Tax=Flavobacterium sp. CS20 TaxID=2775246 RepID=UPI001FFD5E9C|nr:SGNH/GDSL hydrolase family protein [Flavobacterium sp. CS20]
MIIRIMKPFALLLLFALNSQLIMAQQTYLALGDSYTIGEGLKIENSWPYQLQDLLNNNGFNIEQPKIIAKTGWRTDELIRAIQEQKTDEKQYDIVSLLIGVNNQYQNKALSQYKKEFKKLLEIAISKCKSNNQGVFVVSIPDYGVTPFAQEKDKPNAIKELKKYNTIAKKQCQKHDVAFYDITDLSAKLSHSDEMLINDRLHPNDKQYQAWVQSLLPQLKPQLNNL